jgi:hypothetical protein
MTTDTDAAVSEAIARMAEAASAWLDALDAGQRAKASFDFAGEAERTDWAYFPRDHHGLPLLEQDPRQQKLAHVLITTGLSFHAYAKVNAIIALESVLNLQEGRVADAVRDPGRYFVSVFGAPGGERWSWRLEGHHVYLQFTIIDGRFVAPLPLFLGANPAEVRHGHATVSRPLAEEADVARELLASLNADQRRAAVICAVAPPDFVLTNAPLVPESSLPGEQGSLPRVFARFETLTGEQNQALRFERARPAGLSASQLDAAQRELLSALLDLYVERLPEPLAAVERAKIERAGADGVHFAWAGSDRTGEGHYYRLHGPSLLNEYDNTQNDANHVHAVWRDPGGDFGRNLLREHAARDH